MTTCRKIETALLLATLGLSALALPAVGAGTLETGRDEGDWRRHEITRTYRDEDGCRLRVVSFHRINGDVDTRESRECGRD